MAHLSWNYTTLLNIAFLLLAAVLVVRFVRTGGMAMLRMMGGGPDDAAHHDQHEQHEQHEHGHTTAATAGDRHHVH